MTTGTELVAASDTGAQIVPRRRSAPRDVSIVAVAGVLPITAPTTHRTNVPSSDELDFVATISAYRRRPLRFAEVCAQRFPDVVMPVGR